MIFPDKIQEWWQHSVIRSIFWILFQCTITGIIDIRYWWLPLPLWFLIYLLDSTRSDKRLD